MSTIPRRDLLRQALTVAGVSAVSNRRVAAADVAALSRQQDAAQPDGAPPFFPGFKTHTVKTSGAEIHVAKGGSGPPVLLLHGAPQTHISWRLVAPELARTHTVIVPDLRGYGDSSNNIQEDAPEATLAEIRAFLA